MTDCHSCLSADVDISLCHPIPASPARGTALLVRLSSPYRSQYTQLTDNTRPSTALANLLHVASFAQSTYITFLGYNSIPSLSSTHLLLVPPLLMYGVLFLAWTLSGWNASLHLAPILWAGGGLRGMVGGAG